MNFDFCSYWLLIIYVFSFILLILNVHNALFYCFSRVSIRIWVVCSCACSILDQQHDFDPHSCFLQQSKECLSTLHRLEMLTNTDKLVLFWIFFEWLPYVVCVTEQLLHWLCAANIDTQTCAYTNTSTTQTLQLNFHVH